MQDVDQINAKLRAMLKQVQEEKTRREEEKKKAEIDKFDREAQEEILNSPQETPEEDGKKESEEEEKESTEQAKINSKWRSMRLKPKFEVVQLRDAIVLQAYIPGMKQNDIAINHNGMNTLSFTIMYQSMLNPLFIFCLNLRTGRTFTIEGFRAPTEEEETAMKRQLPHLRRKDPWGLYYPRSEDDETLLLRMVLHCSIFPSLSLSLSP